MQCLSYWAFAVSEFMRLFFFLWFYSPRKNFRSPLPPYKHNSPQCVTAVSDLLRAGRSGIESQWARDIPPVQTGPGGHPASYKTGTGNFPGVKCGRGVLLTTHPLLMPPLGHTGPVTGSLYLFFLRYCSYN